MSALRLADAKTHLNMTQSVNDGELQTTIDSAEAAIAKIVGPLAPITKTYRLEGRCHALMLPSLPVISLTSVTPVNGSALTLSDLYLNVEAGVVSYVYGAWFSEIAYDVVYQAGRSTCPDDLLLAVKELVRHMWQAQQGPVKTGPLQSDTLANTLPGAAYAFPIRVTELLAPHMQPGFA